MDNSKTRPVFLNLLQIRMPVTAVISILHRLSGLLLFFCIPVAIYLLDTSLKSVVEFNNVKDMLDSALVQFIGIVMLWLLLHHMLSGIRFLLIDIDIGVAKNYAKNSAWIVSVTAILLSLIIVGTQF